MEHQRQQPSISIAQQIQRLQMNRLNRDLQKKPQLLSNSNGSDSTSRVETYATLVKPPPNLMKSRKQQFHSPNGESFLREEPDPAAATDEHPEGWPKRSKKDDDPPMIISGVLAAATAACYSPQPGSSVTSGGIANTPTTTTNSSKMPNQQNGSSSLSQQRPAVIMSPTSSTPTVSSSLSTLSTVAAAVQTKEQIFKSKLNPQLLSKIQQNMSNAGNVVASRNQINSPNGKAAMNRTPVPKLMSKTKAQYQILRSQVTRPKVAPKSGGGVVPAPHSNLDRQQGVVGSNLDAASSRPSPIVSQQSQQIINSNRLGGSMPQNKSGGPPTASPPMLNKQQVDPKNARGAGAGGSGRGGKPPPPRTVPTMRGTDVLESMGKQYTVGARRGAGAGGGIQVARGRGGRGGVGGMRGGSGRGTTAQTPTASQRRESLHSPSQSDGSDSDEYGYSTPSPPPTKTFRQPPSTSSPTRGDGPGGRKNTSGNSKPSTPKKISASNISAPKKKDGEEERIYGKGYKCPPIDKVASYLTKKGVRIWICLVCEETEKEISRGPMICCDGCEDWYHFFCVGIEEEPPEDAKWFCKRCIYKKLHNKNKGSSVGKSDTDSDSAFSPSSSSGSKKSKGNSRSSPTRNKGQPATKAGRKSAPAPTRGGGRGGRGRK